MRNRASVILFLILLAKAFAANTDFSNSWMLDDGPCWSGLRAPYQENVFVSDGRVELANGVWGDLGADYYSLLPWVTVAPDGHFSGSASRLTLYSGDYYRTDTETIVGTMSGNSISFTRVRTVSYLYEFIWPGMTQKTLRTITEQGTGTFIAPDPSGYTWRGTLTGTYVRHDEHTGYSSPPLTYLAVCDGIGSLSGPFQIGVVPANTTVRFLDADKESRPVCGAVADGSSRVILELHGVRSSANVTIPAGDVDGTRVSGPTLQGGVWRRTWQAPESFGGSAGENTQGKRAIGFTIVIDGQSIASPSFYLHKAPVVLLHGLWAADPPIWTGLKAYLKSNGFNVVNDDSYPDDYSFEQNHYVVRAHVDRALAEARQRGLVAKKADVVGHSMGGILIEKYGDSSYIRRAVTVGTPHFGSPWANYLLARPWLELVLNVFGSKSMRHGAISDLQTGVCNVPGGSLNVPVLAIAGESSSDLFPGSVGAVFSAIFSIATLAGGSPSQVHAALFGTATSDWVVSVPSQAGGLSAEEVPGIWHLEEPGNSDVFSKATDFLNAPTGGAGTAIAESTQPQIQMCLSTIASPPSPAYGPLTNAEGGITITAPSAGTMYSPGDAVHVSVVVPPGTTKVWVAMPGSPAVISQTPPFAVDITIPQEAIGQSSIIAVAWGGQGFLAMTSTVVNVTNSASVASLKVWPDSVLYLSTDEILPFVVHGVFTDGVERDITASQCGTAYATTDASVASIDTNGVLTAKAPGYCLVIVSNGVSQQTLLLVQATTPPVMLGFGSTRPWTTNGFDFMLQGPIGFNYVIQASTNLLNWQPITNFVSTNSTTYFRDSTATNYGRRFYRAVVP
jgi:hypothetical protein